MLNFVDESSKARLAYAIPARNSIFMLLPFLLQGGVIMRDGAGKYKAESCGSACYCLEGIFLSRIFLLVYPEQENAGQENWLSGARREREAGAHAVAA
jgi:hypothetical protein